MIIRTATVIGAIALALVAFALIGAFLNLAIVGDYLPVLSGFGVNEDSALVDAVLTLRESITR